MVDNPAKNLRELASGYYHGQLLKSDYRQQRAIMLNATIEDGGRLPVDQTQPRPERVPQLPQRGGIPMSGRRWLLVAALAALVAGSILLFSR